MASLILLNLMLKQIRDLTRLTLSTNVAAPFGSPPPGLTICPPVAWAVSTVWALENAGIVRATASAARTVAKATFFFMRFPS